jgi:serine/threonine protein kinase
MSGSLSCPRCRKALEYSGDRPSFCAYCGHALAETEVAGVTALHTSDEVPQTVGGYRLLRPLGAGGMGTVHEAEEVATGRRVALKLIAADHADSPDAVERFRREGRLASAISHPRCVFVHAADEENGRPYIVMELMPGPTLQDRLDQHGPLPVDEAGRSHPGRHRGVAGSASTWRRSPGCQAVQLFP